MTLHITKGVIELSPARLLYVDFSLNEGDIALLIGPNGSGKTTLLDTIAGVRSLLSGSLYYSAPDQAVAYAVQDSNSGLLPWQTVHDNILLPAFLHNALSETLSKEARRLLETFRLHSRAHDFCYKLSGGERQVVNIIRALCTPCSIALMDEPFGALHNDFRSIAVRELSTWLPTKTAIFVSHDPADLSLPFTRFLLIDRNTLTELTRHEAETRFRRTL